MKLLRHVASQEESIEQLLLNSNNSRLMGKRRTMQVPDEKVAESHTQWELHN